MQITVTGKGLETMTTLLISKASKPLTPYSLVLQLHSPGGCRQNMLMTLLLLALLKA